MYKLISFELRGKNDEIDLMYEDKESTNIISIVINTNRISFSASGSLDLIKLLESIDENKLTKVIVSKELETFGYIDYDLESKVYEIIVDMKVFLRDSIIKTMNSLSNVKLKEKNGLEFHNKV